MIFCLRNSCVALLNRHEGKCKLSVQYMISKLSWDMRKFPFHFWGTFWLAQKSSHHELRSLSRSNPKIRGISFSLLFGRFSVVWWDDLVNYFVSFLFFHYWKSKKSPQWSVTQKNKLFKLLETSIALFSTSDIMKK